MTTPTLLHLSSRTLSLVLELAGDAVPVCRHFGARLNDPVCAWSNADGSPQPNNIIDHDPPFTVLPVHGFGWYGAPALSGSRPAPGGDLDWAQQFRLTDCRQQDQSLTLTLRDDIAKVSVQIDYTLDADSSVLTVQTSATNYGDSPFRVDWLAAASVPLPRQADQVLGFYGRWALEFQEAREQLGIGTWRRDNRRGRTSNDCYPGVIVGTTLDDDTGAVWGAHLGWSGNHTLQLEPLIDDRRQLQLGEWLAPGEVVLAAGETYCSPTAYLSYSAQGLNGLSANFHRYVRHHLVKWPTGKMTPRPVHLNTWEAMYFDHDLDDLKSLAEAGAAVGVERFVLDDGWFHRRDHDRAALGDWWPDATKYPHGLLPLIEHVRALGMEFGLWVEPEMVNPDSELYRAHPDWALHLDGRPLVTGRNQLVLDLARPEVSAYLFNVLDTLLSQHPISYFKWDMNRDLATAGHHGRAAYHRQIEALYALLDNLRRTHPDVEIETCASGGSRPDYGILAYTHRVWASDCNDALTRISIQRGFQRFLPPELMGSHIGPSPSHTTGRRHELSFRAAVALFGHLGLEQDVRKLDADERAELAGHIATYKAWRHVLHGGRVIQSSQDATLPRVQVMSEDGKSGILAVYRLREDDRRYVSAAKLQQLDPTLRYRIVPLIVPPLEANRSTPLLDQLARGDLILSGAELADFGLPLPQMHPESALVVALQAV